MNPRACRPDQRSKFIDNRKSKFCATGCGALSYYTLCRFCAKGGYEGRKMFSDAAAIAALAQREPPKDEQLPTPGETEAAGRVFAAGAAGAPTQDEVARLVASIKSS